MTVLTCFKVNGDYPRTNQMTYVEGGTFSMGSDDPVIPQDGEGPARTVVLNSFYLDIHEVSNMEFEKFVEDTDFVTEVNLYFLMCFLCLKRDEVEKWQKNRNIFFLNLKAKAIIHTTYLREWITQNISELEICHRAAGILGNRYMCSYVLRT